jgi:hypothetical protein
MRWIASHNEERVFFLSLPPLSVVSTLDLQIVSGDRCFESSINNELCPVDAETAANSLLVRSWYREVCRLLMQQEHVTVGRGRASGRRRTKV